MKKTMLSGLCLILGLSLAPAHAALNLSWMKTSPARNFNELDWKLLKEAVAMALDEKENGETVEWKNDETGNHGSLKPISRVEVDGRECRDMEVRNFAGNLNGGGTYRLCRMEDGSWKLLGATPQ
ncbi:MAG: RT0821/Lpp0805 family surface protein [Candidatus Thiodiazotropha sp.]